MGDRYLLHPSQIDGTTGVGGKAAALAAMSQADLPVPPWFVVLPSAFDASATPDLSDTLQHAASAEEAQRLVGAVRIAPDVAAQIDVALRELGAAAALYAVRSSALQEDSARHSFAGQLDSFLFVPADEVAARIVSVWQSAFGARTLSYRREAGLDPIAGVPAVIVQRMIDGAASGVAFSADPVSGRRGIAVVAAVPGLGSALVSGEAASDTWRVDREGAVVERAIAAKSVMHRADPACAEGVRSVPVPAPLALQPALSDDDVRRVATLARLAEMHFCRPQDIEWTLASGQLYLLQSRPITTLADTPDPDAPHAVWDNSNIIESYSGVTTPLTFSFARRAYEHVYREFCRLMRVPETKIAAHADTFACMLGLIEGRVYYNLCNWYRMIALLPGYASNRRFLEQMLGMRETGFEPATPLPPPSTAAQRVRDAIRLAVMLVAIAFNMLTLDHRVARFYRRLQDNLGRKRPDLSGLRADELAAYYRDLERRLLLRWDAPVVNDFAVMIFHGLLRRLCARWLGEERGALSNALLCGDEEIASKEPARRVRALSRLAARDAALVTTLCTEPLATVRAHLRAHADLRAGIDEYLERFGDRCMDELKLESATLHDDPTPLLRAIGQCAAHDAPAVEAAGQRAIRTQAEARVRDALAWHPLRRIAFASVLAGARSRVRTRENLRFERTRAFGRARQILVELGRRLYALDVIATPHDVFYLEVDELLAFVEARSTMTDLKGLVDTRRAEFARYRNEPPLADRFETHGIVYRGHRFCAQQPAPAFGGESLRGLGCCPGTVRGPVRIVADPRSAAVHPGEIIVAERTDPGWVMIFPSASGLLVERGSLLSHSAIVARELGLPTIVSLDGLTHWLADGQWVEMNGATGVVTRIAPQAREEAHAAP